MDHNQIDHNRVKLWRHFPSEAELPAGVFIAVDEDRVSLDGRYLLYRRARESMKFYGRPKRGTNTVHLAFYVDQIWAKKAAVDMACRLNEPCSLERHNDLACLLPGQMARAEEVSNEKIAY
jgi:hypothetical protein